MSYAEAIVTIFSDQVKTKVQMWFEGQGFQTIPMKMGILITGDEAVFQQSFALNSEHINASAGRDMSLPIPAELASAVSSITIRRTPSI
jgi:hypothetical protein